MGSQLVVHNPPPSPPPHPHTLETPQTNFLPNLVQMWLALEAVIALCTAAQQRSPLNSPLIPSNSLGKKKITHQNILSSSPSPTPRFMLLPYLSVTLSCTHTHTYIKTTLLSNDKRRLRIPSGWHLTQCSSPVKHGQSSDGEREEKKTQGKQPGGQMYPEHRTQGG